MVRAALVKTLGGANNALVWTRIQFRCSTTNALTHVDAQGNVWWPATREDIATETGLSAEQVKHAIKHLVTNEFIDTEEHRLGGNFDRAKSYRPLIDTNPVDRANIPNGPGENTPQDRANIPNVLSIKNSLRKEQILTLIEDEEAPQIASVDALFDEFWKVWPRKVERLTARKVYDRILTKLPAPAAAELHVRIVAAAVAAARHWDTVEHRPLDKTPHAATWLNGERWNDELPAPGTPPSPPQRHLTNAEIAYANFQARYGESDERDANRAALDRGISDR